ncbi:hypothetical protein DH2020_028174 [Rehmannia glutinosa]|uniref:DRBM domain-containing protein n=1 Tax=Rehmannia glutinosa TaxID=99300 RepID=A0ABR0VT39_REHGL
MYKNQLQELAQRSCFNLPSYTCVREGPDHAPRFKAIVNFNGESFESPQYCSNLRQAEHSAAEAALISLSGRGPSHSLAARILDETGVYKNLLQEIAQRVGSPLPHYTTFRAGFGHQPVFTGTVKLAGIIFRENQQRTKSKPRMAQQDASSSSEHENNDEQEQIRIARALHNYHLKQKLEMANSNTISLPFQKKFSAPTLTPSSSHRPPLPTSKILPLFSQKTLSRNRPPSMINDSHTTLSQPMPSSRPPSPEVQTRHTQKLPAVGAAPYVPINQCRNPYHGIAPPVTIRTAMPVFSAPPLQPPTARPSPVMQPQPIRVAPPVCLRQAVPVFAAREDPPAVLAEAEKNASNYNMCDVDESTAIKCLEQLEI